MVYTEEEVQNASLAYFNNDSLAADVWVKKYCWHNNDKYFEKSPTNMHRRMAKEFARIENNYPNPMSEEEIFNLFDHFKYIIPQGSVMSSLGKDDVYASLSNCIVLPPLQDSYNSIMWADTQLTALYRRRCGVGLDISNLRPEGSLVSNSAQNSTGAVSFMERFSNTTREVGQENRRGALMLSIDIRHPDIEQFALIKQDSSKVTGANISIRIRDEFMKAVEKDLSYTLRFPVESSIENALITKTIQARDLWNVIVTCARDRAEPGLLFWDIQNNYSPSHFYPNFENTTVNP